AVSPHNYNSTTLGLAATVHACATMPNFLITEYFVNFEEKGKEIADTPFVAENGYIHLSDKPGLGLDIDEEALAANPYKQMPDRALRHPADEGP
ncbi:MAG: mandelate racemase/muconate lactonizing enzyme family protein, partial [bacterium]|nr:mandelate racemase/muconate lactonizing enzyme family protein [bacterium]